jgi:hypothetical protein
MMAIYLSDLWGAPEEAVKNMQPVTVGDMIDYIIAHNTKEPPATIAEALELVA